jgi:hypothetical protein
VHENIVRRVAHEIDTRAGGLYWCTDWWSV